MATQEVTDADFQSTVEGNDLVLVDFWAPWCGPCRAVAPVLEEISNENSNVVIAKMNTDENPNTATQHGIMSIPTMMIFKNGELVQQSNIKVLCRFSIPVRAAILYALEPVWATLLAITFVMTEFSFWLILGGSSLLIGNLVAELGNQSDSE